MADRYLELVPEADVISLEGVGHYPQVESPGKVLRAYFDFMRPILNT
jgi:pimeloyl-ACP methyl ester carboxylesterase